MSKDLECLICGKKITSNNSYVASHIRSHDNLKLQEYIFKYYKNINEDFKIQKCGFCDNDAKPILIVDHLNKTYSQNYDSGYSCDSLICKQKISLDILKIPYNKKKFEHIGANSLYLSLLYKKKIEDVKYSKSRGFREHTFCCNLDNYILKYGDVKGNELYKQRNNKIAKGNTRLWYVEKYGEEIGNEKYLSRRDKMNRKLGSTISNISKKISKYLDEYDIKHIDEYPYENERGGTGSIDFYLPDLNVIIEFYGSFWHCQPSIYKKDYYHKLCKKFAYEIWEKDDNRINYIFNTVFKKNVTILIIWESTKFNSEYLKNLLDDIKNKNTIIEI